MILQFTIRQALDDLKLLLLQLDYQAYSEKRKILSLASIGEHTRHIIELFQCLLNNYEKGEINYDKRQRNRELEINLQAAIDTIDEILKAIPRKDKTLELVQELEGTELRTATNYNRELLYNLEHCIHHQAIIRIALTEDSGLIISDNFGVAPSTVQYRKGA